MGAIAVDRRPCSRHHRARTQGREASDESTRNVMGTVERIDGAGERRTAESMKKVFKERDKEEML